MAKTKDKKFEKTEETPKMQETVEAPKPSEQQAVFPMVPLRKWWRACSNLSSDGKIIAVPGKKVLLTDKQAEHYLKSAPGSIEPVE